MRWAGHAACIWEKQKAYRVVMGKLEGKNNLGIPGCRWDDAEVEVVWDGVDWIHLAPDRDK